MDVNPVKRKRPIPLASIHFHSNYSPQNINSPLRNSQDASVNSPLSNGSLSSPSLVISPSQKPLLFSFSPVNSENKPLFFRNPDNALANRRKSILKPPKRNSLMVPNNNNSVTINAPEDVQSDRGTPKMNSLISRLRQSVQRIEASTKVAKSNSKKKSRPSIRDTQLKFRNSVFRAAIHNQMQGGSVPLNSAKSLKSLKSVKSSRRLKIDIESAKSNFEMNDDDDNPSPLFRSQYELPCPTYEMFEV